MKQQKNNNLEKTLRKVVKDVVRTEIRPIKKSLKSFATKDDLNDFRDRAFKVFATKDDLKEMTKIIIKKTEMKRNEGLVSNDKIAGKMSKIEQEQAADTIGNIRRDEKLDDLEQDVKKVKHKLGMAFGTA